jgi:hypothetical protein
MTFDRGRSAMADGVLSGGERALKGPKEDLPFRFVRNLPPSHAPVELALDLDRSPLGAWC